MERIPRAMLRRMSGALTTEERNEMAIPSYLHPNPLMRWMAWRRVEVLARHMEQVFAQRSASDHAPIVMDFGCGTGVLFRETNRHASRIYGVDLILDAAQLLVDEWRLDGVTLLTPVEAERKIPQKGVDLILAAEVLEHLSSLDETLRFFASRLRPDGRLLISVPTENLVYRLGRKLAGFRGEYHVSHASAIHQAVLRAGFRTECLEKVPAAGPLAMYWVVGYSYPDAMRPQ